MATVYIFSIQYAIHSGLWFVRINVIEIYCRQRFIIGGKRSVITTSLKIFVHLWSVRGQCMQRRGTAMCG